MTRISLLAFPLVLGLLQLQNLTPKSFPLSLERDTPLIASGLLFVAMEVAPGTGSGIIAPPAAHFDPWDFRSPDAMIEDIVFAVLVTASLPELSPSP